MAALNRDGLGKRLGLLVPGFVAVAVAAVLGADPFALLGAMVAYVIAGFAGGRWAALFLFLAPVLLAVSAPVVLVASLGDAVWVLVALLGVAPFFGVLGDRVPVRGVWVPLGVAVVVPVVVFAFVLPGSLLDSDLAARLQVVLLGVGVLVGLVVASWVSALLLASRARGETQREKGDPEDEEDNDEDEEDGQDGHMEEGGLEEVTGSGARFVAR